MIFFFWKFAGTFILLQRTIAKKKASKIGKVDFAHGEGKHFFSFSAVFAFKQTKEHILLQVQPLKMLNKEFLCWF